jgi:hypothetical protein
VIPFKVASLSFGYFSSIFLESPFIAETVCYRLILYLLCPSTRTRLFSGSLVLLNRNLYLETILLELLLIAVEMSWKHLLYNFNLLKFIEL